MTEANRVLPWTRLLPTDLKLVCRSCLFRHGEGVLNATSSSASTAAGMQDKFGRILVPTEEVVEILRTVRSRPLSASSSRVMSWLRWSWTTRPGTWSSTRTRSLALLEARSNRPAPISEADVAKDRQPNARGHRQASSTKSSSKWANTSASKKVPFTDFNGNGRRSQLREKQGARVGDDLWSRHTC